MSPSHTKYGFCCCFELKRYHFLCSSLFPCWFVFLEGNFKGVTQGYNCDNLSAENQREKKGRKALCLGYCPVWTGPVDSRE